MGESESTALDDCADIVPFAKLRGRESERLAQIDVGAT